MGQTIADATDRMFDVASTVRKQRTDQKNQMMDQLLKKAQLAKAGYDIQGDNLVQRDVGPTPEGFVKLPTGEFEKDPTYENPEEKAYKKSRTNYYNSTAGLLNPLGGAKSLGTDDEGVPMVQPTPEQIMASQSPDTQALIKGIQNYEIDPTKTSSIRGNQRQALIGLVKQVDPTYDMTQFPTRSAYRKEVSSGKVGANVRGFNTAIQHLGELNRTLPGVPSNPIQPIEAGQRWAAKTFKGNSPEAISMQKENAALTAVDGELANIFKNSGGTDQEISAWRSAYNPNATREAKKAYILQGIELMKGRMGALESDYTRVMGKPNPMKYTSPESEAMVKEISGNVPDYTEEDIQHTMKKRNMTREQVLQAIGA